MAAGPAWVMQLWWGGLMRFSLSLTIDTLASMVRLPPMITVLLQSSVTPDLGNYIIAVRQAAQSRRRTVSSTFGI